MNFTCCAFSLRWAFSDPKPSVLFLCIFNIFRTFRDIFKKYYIYNIYNTYIYIFIFLGFTSFSKTHSRSLTTSNLLKIKLAQLPLKLTCVSMKNRTRSHCIINSFFLLSIGDSVALRYSRGDIFCLSRLSPFSTARERFVKRFTSDETICSKFFETHS